MASVYEYTCYCGNVTLRGPDLADGDKYCCVPPSKSGQKQCEYTSPGQFGIKGWSDVRCENGKVKQKTEYCNNKCWNPYRNDTYSTLLGPTATLDCQDEGFCLPLKLMCSGVCSAEAELCNQDNLRCIGDGEIITSKYTHKYIDTKLGKEHAYCFWTINNDQSYDYLTREDEERVLGTHESSVNYEELVQCFDDQGNIGIKCPGDCGPLPEGFTCASECKIPYLVGGDWCGGSGDVCKTGGNEIVSMDTPQLCRNATFWKNFTCDYTYTKNGKPYAFGQRCSSDSQHCYWTWYASKDANPGSINTCKDQSDKVFPINTTCSQYNSKFLDTYKKLWCSDDMEHGYLCDGGKEYDSIEDWYAEQDDQIKDPHGCQ